MDTRFKIILSSELPVQPGPCLLGYPDKDYMGNNLAIIEKGNSSQPIFINNNILREALLTNKDFCLKYLGLKVFDQSEEVTKVKPAPTPRKTPSKKEPAKSLGSDYIIVDEELIKKYPVLTKKLGKQIDKSLLETLNTEEV